MVFYFATAFIKMTNVFSLLMCVTPGKREAARCYGIFLVNENKNRKVFEEEK
jgi:hypothetical protein